jgi:hypothetical protein
LGELTTRAGLQRTTRDRRGIDGATNVGDATTISRARRRSVPRVRRGVADRARHLWVVILNILCGIFCIVDVR